MPDLGPRKLGTAASIGLAANRLHITSLPNKLSDYNRIFCHSGSPGQKKSAADSAALTLLGLTVKA